MLIDYEKPHGLTLLMEDESMEKYSLPVLFLGRTIFEASLEGPSETEWSPAGPSHMLFLN